MAAGFYAYESPTGHCGEQMTDQGDSSASDAVTPPAAAPLSPARRGVLVLGAIAASSVVTIRPALAATTGSVLNCKIPIPDPPRAGQWIDPQGMTVAANTQGAFAPPPRAITGEEAKQMIAGSTPPGLDPGARASYVRYIQRLQRGTSGFTCYASLQAPKR